MNFVQTIEPLLKAGVTLQINLTAVGNEIQMDLIPRSTTEHKTGISVPAQSFIATAAELDENLTTVLSSYVKPATSIQEQIEQSRVAMEEASKKAKTESDAKAAANMASSARPSGKYPTKGRPMPELMGGEDTDPDEKGTNGGLPNQGQKTEQVASDAHDPFAFIDA